MAKVITLSSSPSKGRNSDSMLDAFIGGMSKVSGIEVEKIYLSDIFMDAYSYELKDGPAEHETAFKELVEKIQQASGLVIATPTYNFGVPAQLKNLIDRIRFMALNFNIMTRFGQPAGKLGYLSTYFLVSGGTPNWAEKILFFAFPAFWLRGVFLYYNAKCLGAFYSGDVETFKNATILAQCRTKGERYAAQLLKGKTNGILEKAFWRPPEH